MSRNAVTQSTADQKPAPTIYVVDDSGELGEMLEVFLTKAGYSTRVFKDPLRALADLEVANPKPRLIVSDFHMPGINGLELIRRCKLIDPRIRTISASAHLMLEELGRYPVPPDRFLPKPYTTRDLLRMVKELLGE